MRSLNVFPANVCREGSGGSLPRTTNFLMRSADRASPRRRFSAGFSEFRRRFALINYSLAAQVPSLNEGARAYERAVANYPVLAAVMQIA